VASYTFQSHWGTSIIPVGGWVDTRTGMDVVISRNIHITAIIKSLSSSPHSLNLLSCCTKYKHLHLTHQIQWKPLIMITMGIALFYNNNRLITVNGRYKYSHYLTQFIVTTFYMYKKQQNLFKKLM
jgi:hypothetical protein